MPSTAFKLEWDKTGERLYRLGTRRGVLYTMDASGNYEEGVAWNGLTGVDENPEGAETQDIWADNIKYASYQTPEKHKGTIKAYTFPDEFKECNGLKSPSDAAGLTFGQQKRKRFGFCYRTEIGSDTNSAAGYVIHIVYNSVAGVSSVSHAASSENPTPEEMSWEYNSTPVNVTGVTGVETTSTVEISSLNFTTAQMEAIESVLYGTAASGSSEAVAPRLPLPGEVYTIIKSAA